MAYFKDLTPYTYGPGDGSVLGNAPALNVGWLGPESEHEQTPGGLGQDHEFIKRLTILSKNPVNLYRGWHNCHLCGTNKNPYSNGEIRVVGDDGTVYAAPTQILHYVRDHAYEPPTEFVNAVMKTKGKE